jgi:hypothetical protein
VTAEELSCFRYSKRSLSRAAVIRCVLSHAQKIRCVFGRKSAYGIRRYRKGSLRVRCVFKKVLEGIKKAKVFFDRFRELAAGAGLLRDVCCFHAHRLRAVFWGKWPQNQNDLKRIRLETFRPNPKQFDAIKKLTGSQNHPSSPVALIS